MFKLLGRAKQTAKEPSWGSASPEMEESIRRIATARDKRIEILAAAFELQVGSRDALSYELVEEYEGTKVRWYFRRRG